LRLVALLLIAAAIESVGSLRAWLHWKRPKKCVIGMTRPCCRQIMQVLFVSRVTDCEVIDSEQKSKRAVPRGALASPLAVPGLRLLGNRVGA
jgi:hypothetical protein